jgi:hypothetical protein
MVSRRLYIGNYLHVNNISYCKRELLMTYMPNPNS